MAEPGHRRRVTSVVSAAARAGRHFARCFYLQLVLTALFLFLNFSWPLSSNSSNFALPGSSGRVLYFLILLPGLILLWNSLVLFALSLPAALAKHGTRRAQYCFLILLWLAWVLAACLKYPSLFARQFVAESDNTISYIGRLMPKEWMIKAIGLNPIHFSDQNGWSLIFHLICSYFGQAIAFLLALSALWLVLKKLRTPIWAVGVHLVILLMVLHQGRPALPKLMEGSLLFVIVDGWSSDSYVKDKSPKLKKLADSMGAGIVDNVLPPIEQSVPSMASFFTGLLPDQSGIYGQFHRQGNLRERSFVAAFKNAGYCTLVYGGEMYLKFDYGFEHVLAPEMFYQERRSYRGLYLANPFLLASLSWERLRSILPESFSERVFSLRNFEDVRGRLHSFARALDSHCDGRPVLGLLHLMIPHYESVQVWPYYLDLSLEDRGLYHVTFDAGRERSEFEKERDKNLYYNSLRQPDDFIYGWLQDADSKGLLDSATFIVTADHGNYVNEEGNAFFGYKLGSPMEGGYPFLWFGAKSDSLEFPKNSPISSIHLAGQIRGAFGLSAQGETPALPIDIISSETTDWIDGHSPDIELPFVPYNPKEAGFLVVDSEKGDLFLNPEKIQIVNRFRYRRWLKGSDEFVISRKENGRLDLRLNGSNAEYSSFPLAIRRYLAEYNPVLSRELKEYGSKQ